jgi:hypothetical protein
MMSFETGLKKKYIIKIYLLNATVATIHINTVLDFKHNGTKKKRERLFPPFSLFCIFRDAGDR